MFLGFLLVIRELFIPIAWPLHFEGYTMNTKMARDVKMAAYDEYGPQSIIMEYN